MQHRGKTKGSTGNRSERGRFANRNEERDESPQRRRQRVNDPSGNRVIDLGHRRRETRTDGTAGTSRKGRGAGGTAPGGSCEADRSRSIEASEAGEADRGRTGSNTQSK